MIALASLEFYGEGIGVLRWRVSLGDAALRNDPNLWFGILEPVFEVRDDAGCALPWSPRSGGASDGESRGEVEVRELPEAGEIEAVATRLVVDAYGPEGGTREMGRPTKARVDLPVLYLTAPQRSLLDRSKGSGRTKTRARATMSARLAATLTKAIAKASR